MSGFSVYTRQQIWKIQNGASAQASSTGEPSGEWRLLQSADMREVQSLYHAVVPPLVQGAENMDKRVIHGLGYWLRGELMAFVETISGPNGVYLIPVVHPNMREPLALLAALLKKVSSQSGKPVYVAVRDYQSWLNSAVEDLRGESSARKVLMVKHLAHRQKVAAVNPIRKVLEVPGTEPTTSIVRRIEGKK
jgi:hypothetical protein